MLKIIFYQFCEVWKGYAQELYRRLKQMSNTKCSDVTQPEVLEPGTVCCIGKGGNKTKNIGTHISSKHLTPRLLKRNSQRNCSLLSNNAMIQQTSQIIPESSNSECQRDRDTEFTQVLQRKIKSKTETQLVWYRNEPLATTGRDWANLDEWHQSWTVKIPGVFFCINQLQNSKDISYKSA